MTTQQGDKREPVTRDALVRKAAALFRAKGYGSSTTRELAGTLGINRASLYHHTDSKEDLLLAICRSSLEHIGHRVRSAVAEASEEDRLRALIEAHVLTELSDMDMHSVMLVELRSLSPEPRAEVVAMRADYERFVEEVVASEQAAGRLRTDVSAGMLTLTLLNMLNWTIFWFRPDGGTGAEQLAGLYWETFVGGAATAPGDRDGG